MASLIPGYEYDIFISYRQKDNKYDGWVTEFVDNLKRELEATFKDDVSVYFDINPHDGLLETHDVDASLKEKLKCLIFIPIISRTYCDPKSFAWEHEFKAFVESASIDQFGLKVKLPNGNVANRVLPVRIHDLDKDDISLCESLLGGVLRGVEFIYKEPGVNKPLTSEDDETKNLNKTKYRIQINKIANAIREIVSGLKTGEVVLEKEKTESQLPWEESKKVKKTIDQQKPTSSKIWKLLSRIVSILILILLVIVYAYPKIFKLNVLEKHASPGEKISIAVLPFQNMTNDTNLNVFQNNIQESLISSLSNTGELRVRQKESVKELLQNKGHAEYASITPSIAGLISQKLDAEIFIYGSIQKSGLKIRLDAKLIDTKTKDVLRSFEINGPYKDEIIFELTDSLRKQVTDFLLISKLIKENKGLQHNFTPPKSAEALRYLEYAGKAHMKGDLPEARKWYSKALAADSNLFIASMGLENTYGGTDQSDKSCELLIKNYERRDRMSLPDRLHACWAYEYSFGSLSEMMEYIKQLRELDDQDPGNTWLLGWGYVMMGQFDKAIPEFEKTLEILRKWGKEYIENFDPGVFYGLGESYHKTGQYKKEKKFYKEWEHYTPDMPWLSYRQAIFALDEKDTVTANRYIGKYISLMRNLASNAYVAKGLAQLYTEAGMPDRAERYYREAIALEPEYAGRLKDLADFLIESSRNLNEVSELMDKAMGMAKNNCDYYIYLNIKGWGLYKQGKSKEALDILQKTWDEAPYKFYSMKSHLEEVKKAVAGQN